MGLSLRLPPAFLASTCVCGGACALAEREAHTASLLELVTAKELRIERKGIDQYMGRSHDHFIANTNVESPMILPDNQRRFFVCEFSAVFAREMDRDEKFKQFYLTRLAEVLEDERMWRALAYKFYELVPTAEHARSLMASFHLCRRFNAFTTGLQLNSLMHYQEKSVLGFLWRLLDVRKPFTTPQRAADAFVLEDETLHFPKWQRWSRLNLGNDPDAIRFVNHDWRTSDGARWWHREEQSTVYTMYERLVRSLAVHTRPLDQLRFHEELVRILGFTDEMTNVRAAVRCATETSEIVNERGARVPKATEWYCFAPFKELRAAVARAIPSALHFSWDEWDKQRK